MLDDHILKAQTMHSSAYIKPFEEEMKEWEDKLISMQVRHSHSSSAPTMSPFYPPSSCHPVICRTFSMPGYDVRNLGFI